MTKVYFTSDCHFGHANIIVYSKRPFLKNGDIIPNTQLWTNDKIKQERANWMNETIIKRWNQKVSKDDVVYHLGDFAYRGEKKADYWEGRLNGKIVHIGGNHDYNNGVKTLIKSAILEFGNKEFVVQHEPPTMIQEIPDFADAVLCGHVHEHWKNMFIDDIPIINVGVDQWQFTPISVDSILKYLDKVMEEKCNS